MIALLLRNFTINCITNNLIYTLWYKASLCSPIILIQSNSLIGSPFICKPHHSSRLVPLHGKCVPVLCRWISSLAPKILIPTLRVNRTAIDSAWLWEVRRGYLLEGKELCCGIWLPIVSQGATLLRHCCRLERRWQRRASGLDRRSRAHLLRRFGRVNAGQGLRNALVIVLSCIVKVIMLVAYVICSWTKTSLWLVQFNLCLRIRWYILLKLLLLCVIDSII